MASKSVPRGVRLNNPMNVKRSGAWQSWDGVSAQQPDPIFASFDTPERGIEFGSQVLLGKQVKYNLRTVAKIIGDPAHGYAPASENNTSEYVATVSKALGVSPTQPLDLVRDRPLFDKLVNAVLAVESGHWKYDPAVISKAITKARTDVLGFA